LRRVKIPIEQTKRRAFRKYRQTNPRKGGACETRMEVLGGGGGYVRFGAGKSSLQEPGGKKAKSGSPTGRHERNETVRGKFGSKVRKERLAAR